MFIDSIEKGETAMRKFVGRLRETYWHKGCNTSTSFSLYLYVNILNRKFRCGNEVTVTNFLHRTE